MVSTQTPWNLLIYTRKPLVNKLSNFYLHSFFELKQFPFQFRTRQIRPQGGRLCRWIQGYVCFLQDSWISSTYLYRWQIWLFRLAALITSRFQWKRIGPQQNDGSWDLRQQNIKRSQKSQPWVNVWFVLLPLTALRSRLLFYNKWPQHERAWVSA